MKNFFKLNQIAILTLLVIFISCKGKQGDIGPQGPQGTQGNSGPSAQEWNFNITFTSPSNSGSWICPATVSAYDALLIYVNDGSVNSYTLWRELPYTTTDGSLNIYSKETDIGNVFIYVESSNGTNIFASATQWNFKAVLIKGQAGAKKAAIDYKNYDEVKAYYNLND